ncbi:Maf family nucleotide pyrophosphatase [Marinilabiliaceae bacterium ANBcel2]|nr:Maf family nucleotide pyrophosphatase [Marinilabiliaceae bacterium ANBcel2]
MNSLFLDKNIILASKSPRRQELLKMASVPFKVLTVEDVDESYPQDMDCDDVALFLARKKMQAYSDIFEKGGNTIVITADTTVVCCDKILGKPAGYDDAYYMLKTLSGGDHDVITAVVIKSSSKESAFKVKTRVTFKELPDNIIRYYLDNFSPYDKAGAYGIQEWIGVIGVSSVSGSYYNVVGLPVSRIYDELLKF